LEASSFPGEGYRKVWARLRYQGIRTSPRRVLRLMRAHGLLAPTRHGHTHGPKAHDGTIITERVDTMWGTDMTTTFTRQDGQVAVFIAVDQLSLSRLNHRPPGCETYPEVMQGTAQFHHEITDARLPQSDPVFHNATTLHATIDMLDAQPTLVERLVGPLLLSRQLLATGFLGGHEDVDLGQRERQEAQILQQPTPRGQGIRRRLGNRLIMDAATIGVTEKENKKEGID
jgi:hypothetical protein